MTSHDRPAHKPTPEHTDTRTWRSRSSPQATTTRDASCASTAPPHDAMTPPHHVYCIAEAGVNHDGDLAKAERMIHAAAEAGADAVKFQTFTASTLASAGVAKAEYQRRADADNNANEGQLAMLRRLELDEAAHRRLQAVCREARVEFLSSPFDVESARLLQRLGVARIKLGSGELATPPLLRAVAVMGLPILLSTGMARLGEVDDALRLLEEAGAPREAVTLLHCTSQYPTPCEDVNLRAMQTLAAAFPGVAVGYSDHTLGVAIPTAAVALGARVIEKHFTLDKTASGPDHAASLEPPELRAMIDAIRQVELALGHGRKEPAPSERANIALARKSLVAARAIAPGEIYSPDNVAAKRAGAGLSAMRWDDVMGRAAPRAFAPDEPIE